LERSIGKEPFSSIRKKLLPPPDGQFALQNALRAEAARDEYMRALQIFTDLVVPPQDS